MHPCDAHTPTTVAIPSIDVLGLLDALTSIDRIGLESRSFLEGLFRVAAQLRMLSGHDCFCRVYNMVTFMVSKSLIPLLFPVFKTPQVFYDTICIGEIGENGAVSI